MMTVQIDSVGIGDEVVPSNVRRAANLFQSNGLFVRGESRIRPADPGRTEILGNLEFDYADKEIDLSSVSWLKRIFRTAHTKMDFDPEVWEKVEELILNELDLSERGSMENLRVIWLSQGRAFLPRSSRPLLR